MDCYNFAYICGNSDKREMSSMVKEFQKHFFKKTQWAFCGTTTRGPQQPGSLSPALKWTFSPERALFFPET